MRVLAKGLEISDTDIKCLENDLLDIDEWIRGAIIGKVNNCKKRLIREWQPRLLLDPDVRTIPAEETALIQYITARPDYQNRVARDADLPDYVVDLGVTEEEILEADSG